jgi:hypothetical protein
MPSGTPHLSRIRKIRIRPDCAKPAYSALTARQVRQM